MKQSSRVVRGTLTLVVLAGLTACVSDPPPPPSPPGLRLPAPPSPFVSYRSEDEGVAVRIDPALLGLTLIDKGNTLSVSTMNETR